MTEQDAKNLKALRDGIFTIRGLAWSKNNKNWPTGVPQKF